MIGRRATTLLALLLACALALPAAAGAAKEETPGPNDITSAEALAAAAKDPNVHKEEREHPNLVGSPSFKN